MERKNIAGLSMKGGKKDNFFFCLLENYPENDRWFLKSLLQVKDEDNLTGDEAIREWINQYQLEKLIVDFPLSRPFCQNCQLDCPGISICPVEEVKFIRNEIDEHLRIDKEKREKHPKSYERERNKDDEIVFKKDILKKKTIDHILSRSFKRKLKKGFIPYWNRAIDYYIWENYYDYMLDLFNISYDTYGNTSMMILSRFSYLKRHFPKNLDLFEANVPTILIELMKASLASDYELRSLSGIEESAQSRLNILKKIEEKFNIFIYDHDLEILIKNERAFDSFLLSIAGRQIYFNKTYSLPDHIKTDTGEFIFPYF